MKKIVLLILMTLIFVGCGAEGENFGNKTKSPKNEIVNTTWINVSDGSELVFGEDEFFWYQHEGTHDDNYYYGQFEFYRGEEALTFITNDLKQYGVTREEVLNIIDVSDEYLLEDFVVFNLNYSKIVIDGETTIPENSLMPWYGFILKNDSYLDVANMNNGSYYGFEKK